MKICAVVGSSKINGNTDKVTEAFLRGVGEVGNETVKIHLGQTKIEPCLGCNCCTDGNGCRQKDGFAFFAEKFLDCDVIVFATPLYFWGISAQLKAVIDRMYSLGEKDPKGYFKYPCKKCVLIATAADSARHFWAFEMLEQYYHRLVKYFRWTDLGIFEAGSCGGTAVPRRLEETDAEERAYQFGKKLGMQIKEPEAD